jgi:hypothetical protein
MELYDSKLKNHRTCFTLHTQCIFIVPRSTRIALHRKSASARNLQRFEVVHNKRQLEQQMRTEYKFPASCDQALVTSEALTDTIKWTSCISNNHPMRPTFSFRTGVNPEWRKVIVAVNWVTYRGVEENVLFVVDCLQAERTCFPTQLDLKKKNQPVHLVQTDVL